jgi:hypothetical protein
MVSLQPRGAPIDHRPCRSMAIDLSKLIRYPARMRYVPACAAVVASISIAVLMSACSSEVSPQQVAVSSLPQPQPARSVQRSASRAVEDSPERVHAEIVSWFSRAGYRGFQVEALAEHARIESGFRPCASPRSGLRYTYQWGGLRLRRLAEFADIHGSCPPLDKQLAFADNELRSEPGYSCFWRTTTASAALAALRRGFGRGRC